MNWKKQDVVTYRTNRENEISKILNISLGNRIELECTPLSKAVYTLEYGPHFWIMDLIKCMLREVQFSLVLIF